MSGCCEVWKALRCCECGHCLSLPPIMTEAGGRSVCGRCWKGDAEGEGEGEASAACFAEHDGPWIRNRPYELLAETATFPCRYEAEGCDKRVAPSDAARHEADCYFRRWSCALAPCDWEGPCDAFYAHCLDAHPASVACHPYELRADQLLLRETRAVLALHNCVFVVRTEFRDGAAAAVAAAAAAAAAAAPDEARVAHAVYILGNGHLLDQLQYCFVSESHEGYVFFCRYGSCRSKWEKSLPLPLDYSSPTTSSSGSLLPLCIGSYSHH